MACVPVDNSCVMEVGRYLACMANVHVPSLLIHRQWTRWLVSRPTSCRWVVHRWKVLVPRPRTKERFVGQGTELLWCLRLRLRLGKDTDPHPSSDQSTVGSTVRLWTNAMSIGSRLWKESLSPLTDPKTKKTNLRLDKGLFGN